MATELRVVSIHEIPGRAEETATVEKNEIDSEESGK